MAEAWSNAAERPDAVVVVFDRIRWYSVQEVELDVMDATEGSELLT